MTLDNSKQVWRSRNISCNSQTGIKLLSRWPGPTYMSVGYVFELRFSAGMIQPISMIFGILSKKWSNFKKMLYIFL